MPAELTDEQVDGYVAHARLISEELNAHGEDDAVAIILLAGIIKMRQRIIRNANREASEDPMMKLLSSFGKGLQPSDWNKPVVRRAINEVTIRELARGLPVMVALLEVTMLKEEINAQRDG
jgi:hypothetical protein